jgi:hypothetical protein
MSVGSGGCGVRSANHRLHWALAREPARGANHAGAEVGG